MLTIVHRALGVLALGALLLFFDAHNNRLTAQADQDFVLENRTGYTIYEVNVSHSRNSKWGQDILGDDVLLDGRARRIRFPISETRCIWDIRVRDKDGDYYIKWDVNLCRVGRVVFTSSDLK